MANPAADYPTAIHTSTDVSAFTTSKLGSTTPTHTNLEGKQESEVVAVQTKIGTGSSTPTTGKFLKGTGTGASAWDDLPTADASTSGISELAIASELNTGTDATRAVTPDALAGSNYGIEYMQVALFAPGTDAATGDGKAYLHIPPKLNGWNLVYVHALNVTAGTTGTQDIQIANVTDAVDMLSTKLTIDSTEVGSNTAATPAVIDTTKDDVATNDILRIDVDAVQTTKGKGTICTLGFQAP